jgi:hypothetical protein
MSPIPRIHHRDNDRKGKEVKESYFTYPYIRVYPRAVESSIKIEVETQTWCTREPDPNDDWDTGDEDGYVSGVTATLVDLPPQTPDYCRERYEPVVGRGGFIYVVVADYSSGNTFGTSGAQYQVLDVFTEVARAAALADAASNATDMKFEHDGQEYYINWTGYFERLKEVKVWVVQVQ